MVRVDVGTEEENAAARARMGDDRTPLRDRWLRWELRKAGVIAPYRWLAADLAANAIRNERGCLIWQRALSTRGYGKLKRNGRVVYAHRVALEDALGRPLGVGMVARHACDVRKCIEATHLVEGSQHQNVRDMIERGRAWWQQKAPANRGLSGSLSASGDQALDHD